VNMNMNMNMENTDAYYDKKILLVDDETELLDLISDVLKREGFSKVITATTGIDGLLTCKDEKPDLIVLDINLPDIDGYTICNKIRNFSFAPIIFLSAKNEDEDKLQGLSVGGDDYMTKPFNLQELVFRIKAQLRRSGYFSAQKTEETKILTFKDFYIDEEQGEVVKGEERVALTAKEYQLLVHLAKNKNKILSKQKLCEDLWGYDYDGFDNVIMVHIRHLREKIERDPGSPEYIMTIKGLGYKLVDRT
jgi:DNA-binding response OmpR family regulator